MMCCSLNGTDDFSIALMLIQVQFCAGTTIIYLDKVKTPLIEIEVCIYLFMPIQTGPHPVFIMVVDTATGHITSIRIATRLQPQTVDIVGSTFQTVRETLGMRVHQSGGIAESEIAIVYIDILIPHIPESQSDYGVSLTADESFIDIHPICIP